MPARVTVGTGSTFTATGDYTQSGGSTNLTGGTLTSTDQTVTINGGLLGGSGTVNGDVTSRPRSSPVGSAASASSPSTGNYTQTSSPAA